jgi:hypothetical protein
MKKNGDFVAIALLSGLITALAYMVIASTISPPSPSDKPFNFGFGPEMDCQPVGLGEPVCVRKR